MGAISLEYFGGNMDCQKYASLLENSVNKIKEILQKMKISMILANINQMPHWNFYLKRNTRNKMVSLRSRLESYWKRAVT